ncbi:MAG: drug resistance transporter, EmrB/QacA subfamily [Pseudonocardiales bacterium]|nr:drug resistance transporter, EmrB/QacA subfamily [Pseudonocardiales bacterium]
MRKWLPLTAVCLGTFMLLIDVTIVNVALPAMAGDLKTSFSSLQWVVDAYALVLAALVLGIGSVADQIGHRKVFVAGLIVFGVSSFVCGISPNSDVLIAARSVQGLGGAAMFATTFPLINSSYSGRDRGTAYGLWGAVAGASAAVGPILGGILTEAISWRWIFFVNVPVSVGVVALCVVLKEFQVPVRSRIDLLGILAFTVAAAAATYGMIRASDDGWSSPGTWGLLLASALVLGLFLVIESKVSHPLIDLELLRNRTFVGVLIAGLILNFAAFAYLTYTSIWLQSVLDLSPIQAGLTGLPLSLAAFIVAALTGRLLHNAHPGRVIGSGMLLIGLGGFAELAFVRGDASWVNLVPGLVLVGLGVGLVTPLLGPTALGTVPPQKAGMAGGAVNTVRQLGFAFGIAVLGTVFASRAASSIADRGVPNSAKVAHTLAGGQAGSVIKAAPAAAQAGIEHTLRVASVTGLQGTFLIAAITGVLAGVLSAWLIRPAASHESAPSADATPAPVA